MKLYETINSENIYKSVFLLLCFPNDTSYFLDFKNFTYYLLIDYILIIKNQKVFQKFLSFNSFQQNSISKIVKI